MLVDMKRTLKAEELKNVALVRQSYADGTFQNLRISNKLSLSDIAASVDSTPGAVWKWEQGLRVPRTEAAIRCAPVYSGLLELDQC